MSALRSLAIHCFRFSPTVGWEASELPDSLLLDVTGCVHLFDNERGLAHRIITEFRQLGYRAVVASASTIGAAWALAHFGTPRSADQPTALEHEASGSGPCAGSVELMNTPAAVRAADRDAPPASATAPENDSSDFSAQVPPQSVSGLESSRCHNGELRRDSSVADGPEKREQEVLLDLPIEALRLDEQTVRTLRELDICRIAQLEALPRSSLPARFGTQITQRLDQALGRIDETVDPLEADEIITAERSFEHPLVHRNAIETVLRELSTQILDCLCCRDAGVLRLQIRLVAERQAALCCSVGFISPCQEVEHLVRMMLARLSRLEVPDEITEVHLQVISWSALATRQISLLDHQHDTQVYRQFALLLERLSSRLGEQRVLRPRLRPDAQPELAYGWETAVRPDVAGTKMDGTSKSSSRSIIFSANTTQQISTARPLAIKSRPLLITVVTALSAGPPIRFRWEGHEYVVARSWGPERITTGWWRDNPIHRDYYRIETDQGQQLWLYCTDDRSWFLHGEFV